MPYVGSDVLSSAICMDKLTLKRLFAQAGMPQVDFVAAGEPGWRERCAEMGLPLWVKPSRLGSSVGISRVETLGQLEEAVELARRHDPRVIVEASASRPRGRVLAARQRAGRDLAAGRGDRRGRVVRLRDQVHRRRHGARRPGAELPDELVTSLRELAVEVYQLAGCSGLARCDFFVEPDGRLLVNEINTMPGFTETSVYAKLWEASGLAYPTLCDRLVNLAVERHVKARSYEF